MVYIFIVILIIFFITILQTSKIAYEREQINKELLQKIESIQIEVIQKDVDITMLNNEMGIKDEYIHSNLINVLENVNKMNSSMLQLATENLQLVERINKDKQLIQDMTDNMPFPSSNGEPQ